MRIELYVLFYVKDWALMGSLFGIKQMETQLCQLLDNDVFRDFIQHSPTNWNKVAEQENKFILNQNVAFLYCELGNLKDCFTYFTHATNAKIGIHCGRHTYLSNLSCLGNFEYYTRFIRHCRKISCGHDEKDLKNSRALHTGILAMIAAFVRIDLLDVYILPADLPLQIEIILLFLIKPSTLTRLKQGLNDKMIEMNDETQDRFELINYSPLLRLKFLYKLCWCSQFGAQVSSPTKPEAIYVELRDTIIDLYNNFESFSKEWNLKEYKDLHNNVCQQREIHSKFKLIVQYILGMSCFYKCKDENKVIRFENQLKKKEYHFVDLLPKKESDVTILYNRIVQEYGESEIQQCLQHPTWDNCITINPVNVSKENTICFENVLCPMSFMQQVYRCFQFD